MVCSEGLLWQLQQLDLIAGACDLAASCMDSMHVMSRSVRNCRRSFDILPRVRAALRNQAKWQPVTENELLDRSLTHPRGSARWVSCTICHQCLTYIKSASRLRRLVVSTPLAEGPNCNPGYYYGYCQCLHISLCLKFNSSKILIPSPIASENNVSRMRRIMHHELTTRTKSKPARAPDYIHL